MLTENSHTVVHASYRASRNHAGERHIGLFFNEVTGCNVHGVIHITAGRRLTHNSRRRNFQLVTLSTHTSCTDCTFQSGIGNGNNLARATVLLKGIGYDTQPSLIISVRLIPRFKRANEIFSVNGSPLTLSRKLRSKTAELTGLSVKAITKVRQGIRESTHGRRARRRNSHAPRTSPSALTLTWGSGVNRSIRNVRLGTRGSFSKNTIPPLAETAPVTLKLFLIITHESTVPLFFLGRLFKTVHHISQLAEDIGDIATITNSGVNICCCNIGVVTYEVLQSSRQRVLKRR